MFLSINDKLELWNLRYDILPDVNIACLFDMLWQAVSKALLTMDVHYER